MSNHAEDQRYEQEQAEHRATVDSAFDLSRCADALERIAAAIEALVKVPEPHWYHSVLEPGQAHRMSRYCGMCGRGAEDPVHLVPEVLR